MMILDLETRLEEAKDMFRDLGFFLWSVVAFKGLHLLLGCLSFPRAFSVSWDGVLGLDLSVCLSFIGSLTR